MKASDGNGIPASDWRLGRTKAIVEDIVHFKENVRLWGIIKQLMSLYHDHFFKPHTTTFPSPPALAHSFRV